jgi:hypothetical protein
MENIPESDWKKLRSLQNDLLDLACERILEKIAALMAQRTGNAHETYLTIWDVMKEEDGELSAMFDDVKRSNAIFKLAQMKRNRIISDERFEEFSAETKHLVNAINE